jgi:hypothetical protein
MDFQQMLGDAFSYTREGIIGNLNRWLKLVLAVLCLGIPFNGYIMRIYRGEKTAPEADQWETLFVDGLKLLCVGIVYAIPLIILWGILYVPFFLGIINGTLDESALDNWEPNFLLMIVFYIVEIAVAIIMPVASIRFARTGSFSEAFNFSAILATIGRIGWISYIVAYILVSLVIGIPIVILVMGSIILGGALLFLMSGAGLTAFIALLVFAVLLMLVLSPIFGVFQARYMTRVYDSAAPAEPVS